MTIPEGDGVIIVPKPQREGEPIQEEIINHMRIRKLRYNAPKTTTLKKARLGQQQNNLLSDWMDYEQMEDDVLIHGMRWEKKKRLVPMITNVTRTQDQHHTDQTK